MFGGLRAPFFVSIDWACHPEASAVINIVRLYLHQREEVPFEMRSVDYPVVIDCDPSEARRLKRQYQRRGLEVIALPL